MENEIDVSVPEAARLLGVTMKYVYDLLYSGRLKAEKKMGRWRIPTEEIEARLKIRGNQ
jgi:excisionase family DNA binding protein